MINWHCHIHTMSQHYLKERSIVKTWKKTKLPSSNQGSVIPEREKLNDQLSLLQRLGLRANMSSQSKIIL